MVQKIRIQIHIVATCNGVACRFVEVRTKFVQFYENVLVCGTCHFTRDAKQIAKAIWYDKVNKSFIALNRTNVQNF